MAKTSGLAARGAARLSDCTPCRQAVMAIRLQSLHACVLAALRAGACQIIRKRNAITKGGGFTPQLAATGCAKACRPRRWRLVACTLRRTVHRHAVRPHPMELPRHASSTRSRAAAGAFSWGADPARVRVQAGEAVTRGCRVSRITFRVKRPVRPWLVVNPGGGAAAPWASWPQPSSTNNFPAAARPPRAANSLRLQVLHAVAPAARCGQPIPRKPDHNKDALA